LGGVLPKGEITSEVEISVLSEYPNNDPPNQEKNQIERKHWLYIQKADKETYQENIRPLGRG